MKRNQDSNAAQARNMLVLSSKISYARSAAQPVFMYDNAHLTVCAGLPMGEACKLIYSLQAIRNWHSWA